GGLVLAPAGAGNLRATRRRRRLRSGLAEPVASGPRHRAARALRGDPFMAAGPSRVSRRLRRQPLIRDAAVGGRAGVAVIRALLLRAFSFHRPNGCDAWTLELQQSYRSLRAAAD